MDNIYFYDMPYNEMVIALEDFEYNSKVKCSIPSLLLPNNFYKDKKTGTIMNRDEQILGINKNIECKDYINVFIPDTYSRGQSKGKKGDKFILSFIGGGQEFSIIGRIDE